MTWTRFQYNSNTLLFPVSFQSFQSPFQQIFQFPYKFPVTMKANVRASNAGPVPTTLSFNIVFDVSTSPFQHNVRTALAPFELSRHDYRRHVFISTNISAAISTTLAATIRVTSQPLFLSLTL